MGTRSFHFRMSAVDQLDKQVIDWLVKNPNRSESIREALRVYYFLRERGIPVAPVSTTQTTAPPVQESVRSVEPDDPTASDFFQAMKAGVEDWM